MRALFQRGVFVVLFAAGAPAAFASVTPPLMRPGFWQQSMVMNMNVAGQPPDTDKTPSLTFSCMSLQTMTAEMSALTGAVPGCVFDLEGGGADYTMTTKCANLGGEPGKMTGTGTITLDGNTAMHVRETSTVTSAAMNATMDMSADSKWVGQCPAGVVPGDFGKMANGAFQKEGNFSDIGKVATAPGN